MGIRTWTKAASILYGTKGRRKKTLLIEDMYVNRGGGHSPLEPLLGQIQIAKAATYTKSFFYFDEF